MIHIMISTPIHNMHTVRWISIPQTRFFSIRTTPLLRQQQQQYKVSDSQQLQKQDLDAVNKAPSTPTHRKRLVIVGTGWGGYCVLKHINKKLYDVVVVSPRNHFLFTPLLPSTTVGTLEFRSIIEPVRVTGFRNESHFHLSEVVDVNPTKQFITCQSTLDPQSKYSLEYDQLILSVGARSNTFGIPGVEQHAFFLKEIPHAREIRKKIMENLELATQPNISPERRKQLLHFVVIGGGPTGVEFCAELYDFLMEDIKRYFPLEQKEVTVSLCEGREILGPFDKRLRTFALNKINQRKQMKILSHNVKEVKARSITLDNGEEVPVGIVVWTAGVGPQPLVKSLPFEKSKTGQLLTDEYLQVKGFKNIYAIGDCGDIDGYPLPDTAQVAERGGLYISDVLNNPDKAPQPFRFKSRGLLTYIGGYEALAQLPTVELSLGKTETPGIKLWYPGAKMKGWMSWVIWRSAWLTKLGSWRLRMQVPMDWFKTFFMGRDISRF